MDSELARLKRIAAADNWEDPISVQNYMNLLNRKATASKEVKPPKLSGDEKRFLIYRFFSDGDWSFDILYKSYTEYLKGIADLLLVLDKHEGRANLESIFNDYSIIGQQDKEVYLGLEQNYPEIWSSSKYVFILKDHRTGFFWKFHTVCRQYLQPLPVRQVMVHSSGPGMVRVNPVSKIEYEEIG